eukprot:2216960-Pleurochrysis_carterae.AAC.2
MGGGARGRADAVDDDAASLPRRGPQRTADLRRHAGMGQCVSKAEPHTREQRDVLTHGPGHGAKGAWNIVLASAALGIALWAPPIAQRRAKYGKLGPTSVPHTHELGIASSHLQA